MSDLFAREGEEFLKIGDAESRMAFERETHACAPAKLLLVCTGNVCRSPVAQRLFAEALDPFIEPRSAGTHALLGALVPAPMLSLMDAEGVGMGGFVPRQLTSDQIREAALILTMTREHRTAVVELVPGAVRRTFTLREFARLLRSINIDDLPIGEAAKRLSASIPLAAARRSQVNGPGTIDDVLDPYRRSDIDYSTSFRQIQESVAYIAKVITFSVSLSIF